MPSRVLEVARRFSATLDGRKVPIEVRFRLPERSAAGGYCCFCELRTDLGTRTFSIEGQDGVQASLLAFMFMGIELQGLARARGLKIPRHELADLVRLRPAKRQRRGSSSSSRSRPTKRSR